MAGDQAAQWINELSAFGGNKGRAQAQYDQTKRDYDQAKAEGKEWFGLDPNSDLSKEGERHTGAVEASLDQWGGLRQGALDLDTEARREEMMGARGQLAEGRAAQLELLQQVGQRESQVPARRTASLNQAVEQLASANDPRAQLAQLRGIAPGMAKSTMQHAAAEGLGNVGQVAGGMGQIRGQDLQTAAMERGILGEDIRVQLAKESLANTALAESEADIAAMSGAELGLADIQAGAPKGGIDFWNNIFPGIMNAGAAGLGAMASQPNAASGVTPGVSPIGVSQPYGNPGTPTPAALPDVSGQYQPMPYGSPSMPMPQPISGPANVNTSLADAYAQYQQQQGLSIDY